MLHDGSQSGTVYRIKGLGEVHQCNVEFLLALASFIHDQLKDGTLFMAATVEAKARLDVKDPSLIVVSEAVGEDLADDQVQFGADGDAASVVDISGIAGLGYRD